MISAAVEHGVISKKPVLHHLIDVAAAALRPREVNPPRTRRQAAVMSVPAGRLARTSAFLSGPARG